MWQIHYFQAAQLAQERTREANRERLARLVHDSGTERRSRFDGLRRGAAIVAAGIARRLDECAAQEQLGLVGSSGGGAQLPG
jgi:hypothetical protein